MNTLVPKRNLSPLEIVLGIFFAIWTVWCLFLTLMILESSGTFLSDYIGQEGVFSKAFTAFMKAFGYFSYVLNPLLLLWFILMRKQLNKDVVIFAIIGLSVEIALLIVDRVIDLFNPIDFIDPSYGEKAFLTLFYVVDWIAFLFTGIAFFLMSRQFSNNVRGWSIATGVIHAVYIVILITSTLNNHFLYEFLTSTQYYWSTKLLNTTIELIIAMNYFTMFMLFIALPKSKLVIRSQD